MRNIHDKVMVGVEDKQVPNSMYSIVSVFKENNLVIFVFIFASVTLRFLC